jgi:hypothetical protein
MIMNLLSVSLRRLKLVISSRAINNCFFESVGEKEFGGGGGETQLCIIGKQKIPRGYDGSSQAMPARPSCRVGWKGDGRWTVWG